MPELPEVETVRRGLSRHLIGRKVIDLQLRRSDLRFPFPDGFKQLIEDSEITSVDPVSYTHLTLPTIALV